MGFTVAFNSTEYTWLLFNLNYCYVINIVYDYEHVYTSVCIFYLEKVRVHLQSQQSKRDVNGTSPSDSKRYISCTLVRGSQHVLM